MNPLHELTELEREMARIAAQINENYPPSEQPLVVCIGVKGFFNFPK